MLVKKKLARYPLVSIVAVNFDHPEVTCDFIESLHKITYPNIEVIIVGNKSPNDNPSIIKERYPNVILYESNVNWGFAGGNNQGIMRARGEYVMLLNNDTIVDAGMVVTMRVIKEIGLMSYIFFSITKRPTGASESRKTDMKSSMLAAPWSTTKNPYQQENSAC